MGFWYDGCATYYAPITVFLWLSFARVLMKKPTFLSRLHLIGTLPFGIYVTFLEVIANPFLCRPFVHG